MKFLHYFIVLCILLTMTACSGLKRQPDATSDTDTASSQSAPSQSERTQSERTQSKQSSAQTSTTAREESEEVKSKSATSPTIDLFDRIRNGFSWREVRSKHTDDYLRWNVKHPTYLTNLFKRAEPFLFHIVEQIEQRGLPMELVLLPAVESAFKPEAISRSRAAGLWQFIPSTGRYLGLKTTALVDERQDLLKSTETALDYLTFLNKEFDGDWYLTLAAYNGGIGTIQRAIKKQVKRNHKARFQDLKLRSETERYVPKLLALKRIIANPEKYNIALPFIANKPYFAKLELIDNGPIDLRMLANKANIDFAMLKHLNAAYLQRVVPSGQRKGSALLVPNANEGAVYALLSNQAQEPLIDSIPYKIKSGDNLAIIAKRHNTSVSEIKALNNRSSDLIIAGDTIQVPYHAKTATSARSTSSSSAQQKKIHRVQAGDTLWSIARHYKVKLSELIVWNNISKHAILSLGQPLTVFVR